MENRGLFRKSRLWICLFYGLGLCGCAVLKQGDRPGNGLKTYRITVDRLPGFEENGLLMALDGMAILNINYQPLTASFEELPERLTLSVRLNNETSLERLLSRLQSSGFMVRSAVLQN